MLEYRPDPWNQWVHIGDLDIERTGHGVVSIGTQRLPCLSGENRKNSTFHNEGGISGNPSPSTNFPLKTLSSAECPHLAPTPGHLCSAPSGPLDCRYAADHCCCGQCFKSFTFLCLPDAITGTGLWQTPPLCPAEGCGNEGL